MGSPFASQQTFQSVGSGFGRGRVVPMAPHDAAMNRVSSNMMDRAMPVPRCYCGQGGPIIYYGGWR